MSSAYSLSVDGYAELGVNTEEAISRALQVPISIHCWQADDVGGFEVHEGLSIELGWDSWRPVTIRARPGTPTRFAKTYEKVLSLVPGVWGGGGV